jgi:glutamyl-tRNA(Gln) amidotransferase subunit E
MDYSKILKCGIEIHQRLNTKKLFCGCSSGQEEKTIVSVSRRLRPVPGELGDVDPAALFEFLRKKEFVYRVSPNESCLVECDEEPPHPINKEALRIAIQACKLLKCKIPEEVHVMRKTVIDGSNTCGFQRTAIIGLNGYLETSFGKIGIPTVCLEEEAARIEEKSNGKVFYKLSGLGIPLVEIATSPDITSPQQAREVAEKLGLILRSFKVQRGIGSIRQDINISIKGGTRIELKGFQELGRIERLIENEVARQLCLLEIKNELRRRGFVKINGYQDVTEIFKNTKCNFIRKIILDGGKVLAALLPNFSGLLKKECGDRTFGRELSAYAEAYGYGIIHSDEELGKYHLSWEFQKLRSETKAGEEDLIFIIAGKDPDRATAAVLDRAKYCIIGVPAETRVSDNAGSRYTRPLPGAERMYPETDVPAIRTSSKKIEIPETLLDKERELKKKLPEELASQMIRSRYYPIFEEFQKRFRIEPKLIANIFLSTIKDLRRKGFDINKIKKDDLEKIFYSIEKNDTPKDSVYQILELIAKGEKSESVISRFRVMKEKELNDIISGIVKKNPGKKESVLMGLIMERVQARANGKRVLEILRKKISK